MESKGSGNREAAQMLKDIRSAVETIKRQTSTPSPQEYAPAGVLKEFRLAPGLLVALVNFNMITLERREGKKFALYQWIYGVEPITDKLIINIYDSYKSIEARRKAETPGVKAKLAARSQTTNQPVKNKQNKTYKSTSVKTEPKPAVMTTSLRTEDPFKNIDGTIFGYKQLDFMKFMLLEKPTSIVIDKRFTLHNIELITFLIEESRITVSFYMSGFKDKTYQPDKEFFAGTIEMTNIVLAFWTNKLESTKTGAMRITTVPVRDPYNLKV